MITVRIAVQDWSGMRLIDADAIVFTHTIARSIDDGHNWNELCVTKDEIDDMPSAEPDRKKGKWMEKETFDNADYEIPVWQSARCSVCGKYMTAPYGYYFKVFPYCPNCGSYNGDDNEK